MSTYKITKGLDVPIKGDVSQKIDTNIKTSKFVALKGRDFVGMKPTILVKEGDVVKIGQPLFANKKDEKIVYVAPAGGKVVAINRGEMREFLSLVIEVASKEDEVTFKKYALADIEKASREDVVKNLLESGQWALMRRRPFETIAKTTETPRSIFVNALNSNPYAMDNSLLIAGNEEKIEAGLAVLSKLTDGNVHYCGAEGKLPSSKNAKVKFHTFSGKHPHGNVGTHIHHIDPVSSEKTVWHVSLQSLIAIGQLFLTGKIKTDRVISLGGTVVKNGRLITTRLGVNLKELLKGELTQEKDVRIISGSILAGTNSTEDKFSYLGFYDSQVSVIKEEVGRYFMAMHSPGFHLFSVKNIFLSKLMPGKKFDFTTTEHSGERAIFPTTAYQNVMPLDIEAIFLLKSLAAKDIESAIELGALELAEEDLALCSFVCPGKHDHGSTLRQFLNTLEKES